MPNDEDIGASLSLDITEYSRNIQRASRLAKEADDSLDAIVKTTNRAEKALNDLGGDIDVKVDADFNSLLDADKALAALDRSVTAEIDANLTGINQAAGALAELGTPINVPIDASLTNDASIRSLLDGLAAPIDTKLNINDSEIGTLQRKLSGLESSFNVKVGADTSALKGVEEQLAALKQLATIDLVMNVAGLPEQIPLLGAAVEQDKARRIVSAGTGNAENAGFYAQEAEGVYKDNFGADRQEAATAYKDVVSKVADETGRLATTGESLKTITEQTFTTATNTGEEFNQVLLAADQLVTTGLAPNFEAAFDIINNGYQQGLGVSGDLLDTIIEYSSQFADLGFNAQEFFGILDQGLSGGARNTDVVADLLKELNIRVRTAMSGEGTEFDAFTALGVMDEAKAFNAGEITGRQFAESLMASIQENLANGTVTPQTVFDALGTQAEDLTIDAVMKLNPAQVDAEFAKYNGTTIEVSAQLGGDLSSSWEAARRTIESELATSISNSFDIPGKIQQFSEGVSKMSSLIDAGQSIPEAIEIAFQVPGFADTVATLESALGNLGITILQVAANILEGVGQGEAASDIRGAASSLAVQQMTFDLKHAETQAEIEGIVTTGVNRGLSASDLQKGVLGAGNEFVAQGELDKLTFLRDTMIGIGEEQAKIQGQGGVVGALGMFGGFDINALKTSGDVQNVALETANSLGTQLTDAETKAAAAEQAITTRFENMRLSAESKLPGMAEIATSAITPVTDSIVDLSQVFTSADTAFATTNTNVATSGAGISTTIAGLDTDITGFGSNSTLQLTEIVPAAVDAANLKIAEFGTTVTGVMLQAGADAQGLIDKLLSIGTLDLTVQGVNVGGSGGGQIPGESSGGLIPAGEIHRVHGGEMLVGGETDVSVLNRQTSSIIDSAIAQVMASAGMGGGSSNVYNNVTNNFVFNNNGAAAATASLNAAKIRGF